MPHHLLDALLTSLTSYLSLVYAATLDLATVRLLARSTTHELTGMAWATRMASSCKRDILVSGGSDAQREMREGATLPRAWRPP